MAPASSPRAQYGNDAFDRSMTVTGSALVEPVTDVLNTLMQVAKEKLIQQLRFVANANATKRTPISELEPTAAKKDTSLEEIPNESQTKMQENTQDKPQEKSSNRKRLRSRSDSITNELSGRKDGKKEDVKAASTKGSKKTGESKTTAATAKAKPPTELPPAVSSSSEFFVVSRLANGANWSRNLFCEALPSAPSSISAAGSTAAGSTQDVPPPSHTILIHVPPLFQDTVASLSEEDLSHACVTALADCFGADSVPPPTTVEYLPPGSFRRESHYSSLRIGAPVNTYEVLQEPAGDTLFWAAEYCSDPEDGVCDRSAMSSVQRALAQVATRFGRPHDADMVHVLQSQNLVRHYELPEPPNSSP